MNLISLIGLLGIIGMAILLAKALGYVFGLDSYVLGVPIGTGIIVLVIADRWWAKRNTRPLCSNNACGPSDYEFVGFAKELKIANHGLVWKCHCGLKYLDTTDHFQRLSDDGQITRYKVKRNAFARWSDDVS